MTSGKRDRPPRLSPGDSTPSLPDRDPYALQVLSGEFLDQHFPAMPRVAFKGRVSVTSNSRT